MNTATAIAAPDLPSSALPSLLTFVLTSEVSATLPALLIQLVPDSWLFESASTKVAATAASLSFSSFQLPNRPVSDEGVFELGPTSEVAMNCLPPSVTTSPLL